MKISCTYDKNTTTGVLGIGKIGSWESGGNFPPAKNVGLIAFTLY